MRVGKWHILGPKSHVSIALLVGRIFASFQPFHRIFGSCVLGPPQKDYFFAVPWRGSFGRILTMQLEPPKPVPSAIGGVVMGVDVAAAGRKSF